MAPTISALHMLLRVLKDGCDTCDTLKVQIAAAVGEEKTKLESTKELHNRKADKAYLLKREAKAAAEKDKKKRVLIFDLQ
ncbi:hypothetical protein FOCC_FOCC012652 [Frankliniella occidentalis]|nr:hypothetical protein FOCC_FOCC012652 [Frankliniella occidentalis]